MEITIRVLSTFEPDFSSNQCSLSPAFVFIRNYSKKYNAPTTDEAKLNSVTMIIVLTLRKWDRVWIVHSKLYILMCADRAVDLTDKDIHLQKCSIKHKKRIFCCVRVIVWMIWCEHRMHYCGNGFVSRKKRIPLVKISYIYLYGICKAHILVTHQKKRLIFLRFIIPFLRKTVWGTINSSWS